MAIFRIGLVIMHSFVEIRVDRRRCAQIEPGISDLKCMHQRSALELHVYAMRVIRKSYIASSFYRTRGNSRQRGWVDARPDRDCADPASHRWMAAALAWIDRVDRDPQKSIIRSNSLILKEPHRWHASCSTTATTDQEGR
jgi:hypothetical protein